MGSLFVFVGPSGVGKTTLANMLLDNCLNLTTIPSHTTRPRRSTEVDGVDYFFVGTPRFKLMETAGEFLAHSGVYGNNYGTSAAYVEAALTEGKDVLLLLDRKGVRDALVAFPNLTSIFIAPPSQSELVKRLLARGTDSAEVMRVRLETSQEEMLAASEMRYTVINDCLQCAYRQIRRIIDSEQLIIN